MEEREFSTGFATGEAVGEQEERFLASLGMTVGGRGAGKDSAREIREYFIPDFQRLEKSR